MFSDLDAHRGLQACGASAQSIIKQISANILKVQAKP